MQKLAHTVYLFDEFRLDLTRGTLFREDHELKLRPKSFEVLCYLVENQGRLVGKSELIDAVWQETAVTDDSLVQCLKDIRRVLGDESQRIIKTVPRRGYVFDTELIAEGSTAIFRSETDSLSVVIEETVDSGASRSRSRRKWTVALAAAAVLVVVAAGFVFYKPVLAWYLKRPSIAILPTVNSTGDPTLDYVSDGLHESVIMSLSQLNPPGGSPRLRVVAQNIMLMFKNKDVPPSEIGRELGADTVLASRMSQQGNVRAFKFELIDPSDGSVRWSKQYGVELDHPFDFLKTQSEIASDVAALFPINLSDNDRANLTRRYTQNPEAYDLFLKARANRTNTPSSLRASIGYYQRAIELDPSFALAYWALGLAYSVQSTIDEAPTAAASEKSVKALKEALKIDNNLLAARNLLLASQAANWEWEEIQKAGPSHPSYAIYLAAAGRADEAVAILKERLAVAPYNPNLNFLYTGALLNARRPDEAIVQARHTLNLVPAPDRVYYGPESPWIHLFLALAYSQKKMYPEAIAEQTTAIELGENSKTLRAELAVIYAASGQKERANEILSELLRSESDGEYLPPLNMAIAYCSLGETEAAMTWLDRSFAEREDRLPLIRTRPECDVLHADPRFSKLIRSIGLPE